jgi:mercuric ion binding protein
MKTIKLILLIVLITSLSTSLSAQTTEKTSEPVKTETIKVWGKCEMCKARIEKTVKEEGVESASWDQKSKLLTVAFNPSKISVDELEKKLALAGHDTEKYKADDKAYNALPPCCHYERAK